jgi:hypothetical protein
VNDDARLSQLSVSRDLAYLYGFGVDVSEYSRGETEPVVYL